MSITSAARTAQARAELEATLDAIEEKLNVPKRIGELGTRAKRSWDLNPLPWIIGGAVAVAVVGGLIAWAVLSDD